MDCQISQLPLKGAQIPIIMGDCHAQLDLQCYLSKQTWKE